MSGAPRRHAPRRPETFDPYPLDALLGTQARVAVLRVLAGRTRAGVETADTAREAGVTRAAAVQALERFVAAQLVTARPNGPRSPHAGQTTYFLDFTHPLAAVLAVLFDVETAQRLAAYAAADRAGA